MENNEEYYYLDTELRVLYRKNVGKDIDISNIKKGNYYKSFEEAHLVSLRYNIISFIVAVVIMIVGSIIISYIFGS